MLIAKSAVLVTLPPAGWIESIQQSVTLCQQSHSNNAIHLHMRMNTHQTNTAESGYLFERQDFGPDLHHRVPIPHTCSHFSANYLMI